MKQKFESIIKYLSDSSCCGIHVSAQFRPGEDDNAAIARNLNAAFLISLSGSTHHLYREALDYTANLASHPSWGRTAGFYNHGLELVSAEISKRCYDDAGFRVDMEALSEWREGGNEGSRKEIVEKIHRVFFPEGVGAFERNEDEIKRLQEKRKIHISKLNPSPISDPAKEILFTSNILVTTPPVSRGLDELDLRASLKSALEQIVQEEQFYWYDHPIPVGISSKENEVLYGLEGLDRAIEFEKKRGTIDEDARVTCLLSVSVTHEGLQGIVKEYLEDELRKEKKIEHLDIYVFTEADTIKLVESIFVPVAVRLLNIKECGPLYEVFGVDGEYGRHYSFLKAIAAFWKVFIDPDKKGTFKIDLDQVFPQEELVAQAGLSAFEHFRTPLWGAEGTDSEGDEVELGMIAGALVNQEDIGKSLFTPDVTFPSQDAEGDELVFFSRLPQALSTEAEMMTRYDDSEIDGKTHCIQRIHVTGGTNGILIDSLRRQRPFTPTFIGRAEDQAYILSVLHAGNGRKLRYVHKDGLIMRHDKEAFAGEAIKMAAMGKLIGDYVRMLMFSYYARALPWTLKEIKKTIDPFTGCFVSEVPLTAVYLRFALKTASFFREGLKDKEQQGFEFAQFGIKRLHDMIRKFSAEPNPLVEKYKREKHGWDMFYDILDSAEQLNKDDAFMEEIKKKAASLINGCRINF